MCCFFLFFPRLPFEQDVDNGNTSYLGDCDGKCKFLGFCNNKSQVEGARLTPAITEFSSG